MPEPLAPSARVNGARPDVHVEFAPALEPPVPGPSAPESSAPAPSDDDPLFWDRRFDDLPRRGARAGHDRRAPASPGWRERLGDHARDLLADTRAGVVVLVVVAVAAGFVWYRMGAGGEAHGTAPTTAATTAPRAVATTVSGPAAVVTKAATGSIVVHVAGAVTKPGVVALPAGSRVIDAIEAVGGALPDGDLDRLNLAAKLADGERVFVGKPGVADPGASGGTTGDAAAAVPGAKINLNTATQAQLEELPGVGPAFAQAILAERQRRGSFTSVNDLRSVRGIGDKRFADLAALVTV